MPTTDGRLDKILDRVRQLVDMPTGVLRKLAGDDYETIERGDLVKKILYKEFIDGIN